MEHYQTARRKFKALLKRKKQEVKARENENLVKDCEKNPYKALRPRQLCFPADISMEIWENRMQVVVAFKDTRPGLDEEKKVETTTNITSKEVKKAIKTSKTNKAQAAGGLCAEHLEASYPYLEPVWTRLINKCLESGRIPNEWRKSVIKLLYKGKGDTSNPESYRGMALESVGFKLLTRLIAQRMSDLGEPILSEDQFGFQKNRSTLMAVGCLLKDIQERSTSPRKEVRNLH